MFIEPNFNDPHDLKRGWIEVICGPMFSGKTEELIRRITRAEIAGQKYKLFKPEKDLRYSKDHVESHNANQVESEAILQATTILEKAEKYSVIGVDEGQFFDDDLIDTAKELANKNKRVIIAGLDMDYLGNPFDPIPKLMAVSEFVTKLHAICKLCGATASYSYRRGEGKDQIMLGSTEHYEPRCRKCFFRS